ncbi:hypothetical protein C8J56DRAFT_1013911, partial [Mycena floridula]
MPFFSRTSNCTFDRDISCYPFPLLTSCHYSQLGIWYEYTRATYPPNRYILIFISGRPQWHN